MEITHSQMSLMSLQITQIMFVHFMHSLQHDALSYSKNVLEFDFYPSFYDLAYILLYSIYQQDDNAFCITHIHIEYSLSLKCVWKCLYIFMHFLHNIIFCHNF
jgi:hypothetical protein